MTTAIQALAVVFLAGSMIYCALVVVAARRYLRKKPPPLANPIPISVLKPLRGLDEGLGDNLRSFLAQDYPDFEVLFGVDEPDDPARAIVEQVQKEFPQVRSKLLVTGETSYANPKVYSLESMAAAAEHDLIVMSDSDIRVTPDMLSVIAAEFQDPNLGLVTCPYRAVAGQSFWSRLEAIGMNTDFMSGILVARLLEGMRFAVGPTIVARKQAIQAIGGFRRVADSYIDDFLLGRYASEAGFGVELSAYVIEHRIGSQPFAKNIRHRVMWQRGTRCSRPSGYFGQVFTFPLPWALILLAVEPAWWPLAAAGLLFRATAAWSAAGSVLRDPLTASRWWLLPLQDVFSFLAWGAAWFGNKIMWRGRPFTLEQDGRLRPLERDGVA